MVLPSVEGIDLFNTEEERSRQADCLVAQNGSASATERLCAKTPLRIQCDILERSSESEGRSA
jgi:hypothetical protein